MTTQDLQAIYHRELTKLSGALHETVAAALSNKPGIEVAPEEIARRWAELDWPIQLDGSVTAKDLLRYHGQSIYIGLECHYNRVRKIILEFPAIIEHSIWYRTAYVDGHYTRVGAVLNRAKSHRIALQEYDTEPLHARLEPALKRYKAKVAKVEKINVQEQARVARENVAIREALRAQLEAKPGVELALLAQLQKEHLERQDEHKQ